jgi:ribose 5-phosphate isomerase B
VGIVVAIDALEMFLRSEFEGGRHLRRIEKIAALEERQA